MVKKEKLVNKHKVFKGNIFDVSLYEYENLSFKAEIVEHPGAVVMIAQDYDGKLFLVEQYRFPNDEIMYELPAGKLEHNENPTKAAIRELEEEIGYRANELISLGYMYTSPGFTNEKIYIYIAKGLVKTQQNLDEDEYLDIRTFSLEELDMMIANNTITNAVTITTLYKYKLYLEKNVE